MGITLEVSQSKMRPSSDLPSLWRENRAALVNLPTVAVLGGARGRVWAAASGGSNNKAPLPGALVSFDKVNRTTKADAPFGFFARPLATGKHVVRVSAPGYAPLEQEFVVPADGSGAVLDLVLKPLASGGGLVATVPATTAAPPLRSGGARRPNSSEPASSGSSSWIVGGGGGGGGAEDEEDEEQVEAPAGDQVAAMGGAKLTAATTTTSPGSRAMSAGAMVVLAQAGMIAAVAGVVVVQQRRGGGKGGVGGGGGGGGGRLSRRGEAMMV
jgi:hypothetical protein